MAEVAAERAAAELTLRDVVAAGHYDKDSKAGVDAVRCFRLSYAAML